MNISIFIWPVIIPAALLATVILLVTLLFYVFKVKDVSDKLPLPYRQKKYFFSRSEQELLKTLNAVIDSQRFMIFSKVRLADFVEVTATKDEYQKWWNKIRSKHVDFLIWDIQQSKIALVIELDGNSHNSDRVIIRDEFVNKLYETIELRLDRVKVGENFTVRAQEIINSL